MDVKSAGSRSKSDLRLMGQSDGFGFERRGMDPARLGGRHG